MPDKLNGPAEPMDASTERVQLPAPDDKEPRIGQARDRAVELKATVADKLEAGAVKLRDRVSSAEMPGVTPKTPPRKRSRAAGRHGPRYGIARRRAHGCCVSPSTSAATGSAGALARGVG